MCSNPQTIPDIFRHSDTPAEASWNRDVLSSQCPAEVTDLQNCQHSKWLFYSTEFWGGFICTKRELKQEVTGKILRLFLGFGLGTYEGRDGGAPHHGADSSGDVDRVMTVGHVSGWVVLVTRGSVQDGEADVQDVLLKLSPERLLLEVRVTPTLQTLSQPPPVICVVQGSFAYTSCPPSHSRDTTEDSQVSKTLLQRVTRNQMFSHNHLFPHDFLKYT